MERGEVWTLQDKNYASKARPVVIVQQDVESFGSIVTCLLTSFDSTDIPTRVKIAPSESNGLKVTSYVMTDKIVTVDKARLGVKIGKLDDATMREISTALAAVLGLGI